MSQTRDLVAHGGTRGGHTRVAHDERARGRKHVASLPGLGTTAESALRETDAGFETDEWNSLVENLLPGQRLGSLQVGEGAKRRRIKRWLDWMNRSREQTSSPPVWETDFSFHVQKVAPLIIPSTWDDDIFRYLREKGERRLMCEPRVWPISKVPQPCIDLALTNGIIEQVVNPKGGVSMAVVVPEETKRRYRLTVDTLETNVAMQHILEQHRLQFRSLGVLKGLLRNHSWAAALDMKAFFNQFSISPSVREQFVFKNHDQRYYKLARMPMGWVLAPKIAQSYLENIMNECHIHPTSCDLYIDNILIMGTKLQVESWLPQIMKCLQRYNVSVGEVQQPSTIVTHRGVTWNLRDKQLKLKESFVKKLSIPPDEQGDWGTYQRLICRMIYATTVMEIPRAMMYRTIKWYTQHAALNVNVRVTIPSEVRNELLNVRELATGTRKFSLKQFGGNLCTDASNLGYGCVLWTRTTMLTKQGTWEKRHHINMLELLAVEKATTMLEHGKVYNLFVDNTSVAYMIRKQYSPVGSFNDTLLRILTELNRKEAILVPRWLPTHKNPADAYSRGSDHRLWTDDVLLTVTRLRGWGGEQ